MSDEGVKTGLLGKIGSGAARRDEYSTAARLGGWQAFKAMWSGHFTKVLLASLLALIFSVPAIAWVIISGTLAGNIGTGVPFNIFDGIGYASPDAMGEYGLTVAVGLGNLLYYQAAVLRFSVLIAGIAIAGVGIGGLAYVARLYMYGEQVRVVRDFFRGVAANWASGLTGGALTGACVFLVMLTHYSFTLNGWGLAGRIFAMIGAIVLLVLVSIYSFYLVAITSSYKTSYPRVLRDAFLLTFVNFPKNMLAALLASLFVGAMFLLELLMGGSQMGALPWALMFFLGFYAVTGIFVSCAQSAFAAYINEGLVERETKLKNEQFYAAKREQRKQQKAAAMTNGEKAPAKKQPARYVNPKKKKKAGDKSPAEMTPAPAAPKGGYTAQDLAKMDEDRRKIAEKAAEESDKTVSGLEDESVYEDDGE